MISISWTGTKEYKGRYYKVGEWFVDGVLKGSVESPTTSDFELITPEAKITAGFEALVAMEQYL